MDLKRIERDNTAIHCDTPAKAKEFISFLYENGYKWGSGGSKKDIKWSSYEGETCYNVSPIRGSMTFGNLGSYKYEGYTILNYDDVQ